jgi:hypothetical protein
LKTKLNDEKGGEVGRGWFDIELRAYQTKKPMSLGDWRPISLLSTIQKVYNATVSKMHDDWIDIPVWMAGFMEGRQTLELPFAIQQAFERSTVLARGCWVAKLDAKKAFDNMDRPIFTALCEEYGIHPMLIMPTMKEWEGSLATINVAGFESKLDMLAGGHQGGRDTPKLWNVLFYLVLQDQVEEWENKDIVWHLPTQGPLAPRLTYWLGRTTCWYSRIANKSSNQN